MAHVFISYARKDEAFVKRLYAMLEVMDREVWVDWEGIPLLGEWLQEIYHAIDTADACLFVLSPDFVESKTCTTELQHALDQHKRLVPIVWRAPDASAVHAELAKLNWIFFNDENKLDESAVQLQSALNADLDWIHEHSKLLEKAVEWEQQEENPSYGLQGDELDFFETWLTRASEKEPKPTALQTRLVLDSRSIATKRQRLRLIIVAVVMVIVAAISVFAIFQSREKNRQEEIAAARRLLNQSDAQRGIPESFVHSMKLSAQALHRFHKINVTSIESDESIRKGLTLLPRHKTEYILELGHVRTAEINQTGHYIGIAHGDYNAPGFLVWDIEAKTQLCKQEFDAQRPIQGFAFSAKSHNVVVQNGENGQTVLTVWQLDSCTRGAQFQTDFKPTRLRLSGNGRYLSALNINHMKVWNIETRKILLDSFEGLSHYDVADSPDGQLLAVGLRNRASKERFIRVYDIRTGEHKLDWATREAPRILSWPEAERILVHGRKKTESYNPDSGELLEVASVSGEVSNPNDSWFAHGLGQKTIVVRDRGGTPIARLTHKTRVKALRFAGNQTLVTFDEAGALHKPTINVFALDGSGSFANFSPGGATEAISFTADSQVLLIRDVNGMQKWKLPAKESEVDASIRSDAADDVKHFRDRYMVTSKEKELSVTNTSNGDIAAAFTLDKKVIAARASPDGKWLVAVTPSARGATRGGWALIAQVFDIKKKAHAGDIIYTSFVGDEYAHFLVFSDDSQKVFSATRDTVTIWDVATRAKVSEIYVPFPQTVASQPNGNVIATAAEDGSIRTWTIPDSDEQTRIGNREPVRQLSLSTDGRWLASLHKSGIVRLWALQPADLIAQTCSRLPSPCP